MLKYGIQKNPKKQTQVSKTSKLMKLRNKVNISYYDLRFWFVSQKFGKT